MLTKKTITEILSRRFKEILNEPLSGQMARRMDHLQADILRDIERASDETELGRKKAETKNKGGEN